MEKEIFELCIEAIKQISNINNEITINTELIPENGIDSLVLMNMVIANEEAFGIILDDRLEDIRNAKYLSEFIKIIKEECEKS